MDKVDNALNDVCTCRWLCRLQLGCEMLHVVEVQTGTYLGEDDIVRLEDEYGRNAATTNLR